MKKFNYLFYIVLPFLFLGSQCKEKQDTIFTLKGRIVADCSGTPVPDFELVLKSVPTLFGTGGKLGETITDENGYFTIQYKPEGGMLRLLHSGPIIEGMPKQKLLDLGDVILNGTVRFIIKLQVNNNTYTENDTIYVPDYHSTDPLAQKCIVGPFIDGTIVDSIKDRIYTHYPIVYNEIPIEYINYYFTQIGELKFVRFQTPFCSSTFSEAIIEIE